MIRLPKVEFGSGNDSRLPIRKPDLSRTAYGSIWDVREDLDWVDSFWDLSPCGRIRVLMKITSTFAKAEPVSIVFSKASPVEIKQALYDPMIMGQEGFRKELLEGLIARTHDCTPYPALLVDDPLESDSFLVEANALKAVGSGWDDVLILDHYEGGDFVIAETPLFADDEDYGSLDEAERVGAMPTGAIFFMAVRQRFAKELGLFFQTDAGWTDPKVTRNVVRELRAS